MNMPHFDLDQRRAPGRMLFPQLKRLVEEFLPCAARLMGPATIVAGRNRVLALLCEVPIETPHGARRHRQFLGDHNGRYVLFPPTKKSFASQARE